MYGKGSHTIYLSPSSSRLCPNVEVQHVPSGYIWSREEVEVNGKKRMMYERRSHTIYVSVAARRFGPRGRGPTCCCWVDARCSRSGGENWQGGEETQRGDR